LAGIFLTPALLFRFFGESIHLPFGFMCAKLCQMVLLPVGVGQVLRATPLLSFYNSHTKKFKRLQEVSTQNEKMLLRTLTYCSYFCTLTIDYSAGDCLQCLLQCVLKGSRAGTQACARLADDSTDTSSRFTWCSVESI
jgi:hypothetical protein